MKMIQFAIFKRDKEIVLMLEFEGLYIADQLEDDDFKSYWDKFGHSRQKKRQQKYSKSYEFDSISNLLGVEKTSFMQTDSHEGASLTYLSFRRPFSIEGRWCNQQ